MVSQETKDGNRGELFLLHRYFSRLYTQKPRYRCTGNPSSVAAEAGVTVDRQSRMGTQNGIFGEYTHGH